MPGTNETFLIKVNDFVFPFTQQELESIDITRKPGDEFHVISRHRSVTARVLGSDTTGKKLQVEVAGTLYGVEIKDGLDQMLEQMGFGVGGGKRVEDIKAPMPGLVLSIPVNEGQEIKQGDTILILEAMKMENSIVVQHDAKIKKIHVKSGQTVEKGQVLVELE